MLMPKSSCKLQPGFRPKQPKLATPADDHGALDTLAWQLDGSAWERHDRCEQAGCRGQREELAGYCAQREDGSYLQPSHARRLITRTAIAGRWETARPGFLYTVEAIEEEQAFTGFIHAEDAAAPALETALKQAGRAGGLRLGLGRSRGLGQVASLLCDRQTGHLGLAEPLEQRWRAPDLSHHVRGLPADRFAFSLTLYSDALLLDDYGRYQTGLNDAALARVLRYAGAPPAALAGWTGSIRYHWGATEARPVYNWRFAPGWSKRTAEELAVARGSVFVLTAARSEEAAVLALLRRLEAAGIGRRRAEGFGQVIAGHPWHREGLR